MSVNANNPSIPQSSTEHPFYDEVVAACRTVYDPDIHVNIFDMGLIYTIDITNSAETTILMTLTSPGCPVAGSMPMWVKDAVSKIEGIGEVEVHLVWDPPYGLEMMSEETRLDFGLY